MNLIEELGIEKARAIVDGAPEWATTYCTAYAAYGATFHWYGACKNCYELPALRTAIADHDRYWYGQSEEKELEQYAILSQEKIEGGAMLVGDFKNNLTSSEYKNYFQAERMRTVVNAGTAVTNHIATANKDITDHCTDIRNHISPNTKVSER